MTLSMALLLGLVGTPLSIGFMILITYLENHDFKTGKRKY
jgi:hypothetical protein